MAASTELSTLDVVNALEILSIDETRELVFRLKVPNNVLDNIDLQYSGTTRNIQYVEEWLKNDTDASWEKLASGLRRNGRDGVAKEVVFTYISKLNEISIPDTYHLHNNNYYNNYPTAFLLLFSKA